MQCTEACTPTRFPPCVPLVLLLAQNRKRIIASAIKRISLKNGDDFGGDQDSLGKDLCVPTRAHNKAGSLARLSTWDQTCSRKQRHLEGMVQRMKEKLRGTSGSV